MMWSPRALIGLPGNWLMKIKNNTGRLAKISGNGTLRRAPSGRGFGVHDPI
jgi:hypothetical protein